jgi:hypothetical protein
MADNSSILTAYSVAAQAKIIAMQIQNEIDKECGRPATYGPDAFFNEAHNLESLVNAYR